MTIQQLHDRFYVEYDKANTLSTYPNFTHAEIDIWLNKALLMLISRKFTGNNETKVSFEGNSKRVSDLQKLIVNTEITSGVSVDSISNAKKYDLPSNFFIFIGGYLKINAKTDPVELMPHEYIKLFMSSSYNMPWIKKPKAVIEDGKALIIYDASYSSVNIGNLTINYIKQPTQIDIGNANQPFEFNDKIAEELVTLAITLATENIESQRFNTVSQTSNIQE